MSYFIEFFQYRHYLVKFLHHSLIPRKVSFSCCIFKLKVEQMGIEGVYIPFRVFLKPLPRVSLPLLLRDLIINSKLRHAK